VLRPRLLIAATILALLLPSVVVWVFNVRGPDTERAFPNVPLLAAAWLVAIFAPAFLAGFSARRMGWLYGALVATIPIAEALIAKYEVPIILIAMFWAAGIAGGALGQWVSKSRHAL
jgi:hypothetical protein